MVSILFWNLANNPLYDSVARLVDAYGIDVLILAETDGIDINRLLVRLNQETREYHYTVGACEKIRIYCRFSADFIKPIWESERYTLRHVILPARTPFLLLAVHMPDKSNWSDRSQVIEAAELSRTLVNEEKKIGHARTILIGDLNMNPFEDGLIASYAFHSVMSRRLASKGKRTILGREYPFFYNPMWNLFGDEDGQPGTYYYWRAEHINTFWNMFDQVLIRPDLLDVFDSRSLKIITNDGNVEFLTKNGLPQRKIVSDHLPITFQLHI
jgi:hypothetical protein